MNHFNGIPIIYGARYTILQSDCVAQYYWPSSAIGFYHELEEDIKNNKTSDEYLVSIWKVKLK